MEDGGWRMKSTQEMFLFINSPLIARNLTLSLEKEIECGRACV